MSNTRKATRPMFDLSRAIDERRAKRSGEPLRFEFAGSEWTMIHPGDAPATMFAWQPADYLRHFTDLLEPQTDDDGEPVLFPLADLTTDAVDLIVAAWLGGTPGE